MDDRGLRRRRGSRRRVVTVPSFANSSSAVASTPSRDVDHVGVGRCRSAKLLQTPSAADVLGEERRGLDLVRRQPVRRLIDRARERAVARAVGGVGGADDRVVPAMSPLSSPYLSISQPMSTAASPPRRSGTAWRRPSPCSAARSSTGCGWCSVLARRPVGLVEDVEQDVVVRVDEAREDDAVGLDDRRVGRRGIAAHDAATHAIVSPSTSTSPSNDTSGVTTVPESSTPSAAHPDDDRRPAGQARVGDGVGRCIDDGVGRCIDDGVGDTGVGVGAGQPSGPHGFGAPCVHAIAVADQGPRSGCRPKHCPPRTTRSGRRRRRRPARRTWRRFAARRAGRHASRSRS